MKSKWFYNIFLAGVFTLLAFSVFEVGVRIFVGIKPFYDMEMWRYGTFLKERAPDPKMSHRHIANQSAHIYGVDISINSKRLRDREFKYYKKPEIHRILFLGDSLTLGWGVKFNELFVKKLEPMLSSTLGKSVEVINAGIGNYNTEQEWAYYRNEGKKYNPDEVMLLYFINDAEPTPKYHESTFKENSMLLVFLWSRIKKILVKYGKSKNFLDYYNDLYANNAKGWEVSQNSLLAIRDAINKKGGRFLVAVCPELRKFRSSYPFKNAHDKIIGFLEGQNVEYVDLLPFFRERVSDEKSLWVSWEDSHPNALGHKIIADGIFEYYQKRTFRTMETP